MISQTYGQSGLRKTLFLIGFNCYLRELTITGFKQTEKLSFKDFDKVPLPETFVNQIKQNVLTNYKICNNPKIRELYDKLL